MRTHSLPSSLTFVLLLFAVFLFNPQSDFNIFLESKAEPHADAPAQPSPVDNDQPAPRPEEIENVSVTPAPEGRPNVDAFISKFNKDDYYYPYRQEIDVHFGTVFGFRDSSGDKDLMNYLVGFSYLLPSQLSPKWEVGADLSTVGDGHLWLERRFIFNEKGAFRPYYEIGGMQKYVPKDNLASFSNWDNYLFRCGLGLADIITPPRSVRLELEAAVGLKDLLVMFTYGYAWGF